MASLSLHRNGRYELRVSHRGVRRSMRLGKVDKAVATEVKRRVEALRGFARLGLPPDHELAAWVLRLDDVHYDALADLGLVDPRATMTVGQLGDRYLARLEREDRKESTYYNAKVVVDALERFFGSKCITQVTTADAAEWRHKLLTEGDTDYGPLAKATVSRRCRRARSVFKLAVDEQWLKQNPFRLIRTGNEVNHARDYYVPADRVKAIIEKVKCPQGRLLLALARFGGLRGESELKPLRWEWIDWERAVLKVESPKTEHHVGGDRRLIPLHQPLLQLAQDAFEVRPPDSDLILPNWQVSSQRMKAKIERYEYPLWPKFFVNMRASCERDWLKQYPLDQVMAWMGHGAHTALTHYNRVAKEAEIYTPCAIGQSQ